jgi:hypothetical protein
MTISFTSMCPAFCAPVAFQLPSTLFKSVLSLDKIKSATLERFMTAEVIEEARSNSEFGGERRR